MRVNTDISYCNKSGILPICSNCKRNLDLYEDKDNYKEIWWLSPFINDNTCPGVWLLKEE